jgi:predicted pyridoxine 5'-phosphate oxidase superfamily flavin-nucleotide-binding protein
MSSSSPFHEGELAVQRRAGVQAMARRVGNVIQKTITPPFAAFLQEQQMAVIGSIDPLGRLWSSIVVGNPGFIEVQISTLVQIHALPPITDPLLENVMAHPQVGVLVIHLGARQRVRVNGTATLYPDRLDIDTQEVYGNCPKYIQSRQIDLHPEASRPPRLVIHRTTDLTPSQQTWVAHADTFFLASAHPERGTDSSHRGGNPGFIQVVDNTHLLVPDYAGNMMFNTLGNIAANPHIGLLFVDFDRGSTLQLTAKAEIVWDTEKLATFPGAERLLDITITEVIETPSALPLHSTFLSYSRHNPPLA